MAAVSGNGKLGKRQMKQLGTWLRAEKVRLEDELGIRQMGSCHGGSDSLDNQSYHIDLTIKQRGVKEERLAEINAALQRMDSGKYGICEECGDPIGIKRLEACPQATLCIDCKVLAENSSPAFSEAPA